MPLDKGQFGFLWVLWTPWEGAIPPKLCPQPPNMAVGLQGDYVGPRQPVHTRQAGEGGGPIWTKIRVCHRASSSPLPTRIQLPEPVCEGHIPNCLTLSSMDESSMSAWRGVWRQALWVTQMVPYHWWSLQTRAMEWPLCIS